MDEHYLLTTPENVTINFELAGLGSRFLAALLDNLLLLPVQLGILAIAFIAVIPASAGNAPWTAFAWAFAIVIFLSTALNLGYSLLFEIIWNGQTPGKRKVGIRIVKDDGGPITATSAVIRNLIRLVDMLPGYYIIGAIVMLVDRKCRRLGDMAAGTICVKERRDAIVQMPTEADEMPEPEATASGVDFENLDLLSREDRRLIKEYLSRRRHLAAGPAQDLALQIARRTAAKLGLEFRGKLADDFLNHVQAALDRRDRSPMSTRDP